MRAVLDTNVLVSALLFPRGIPGAVLRRLRDGSFTIIFSPGLLDEFAAVLSHPKIKTKYKLNASDIEAVFSLFAMRGELVESEEQMRVCRDPQDDFLLETAVAGRAGYIVTGDQDLLVLKKFRKIRLIKPGRFLALLDPPAGRQPPVYRMKGGR